MDDRRRRKISEVEVATILISEQEFITAKPHKNEQWSEATSGSTPGTTDQSLARTRWFA
jgi:hypothetical protein